MQNRYLALLLSLTMVAAFAVGMFIEPSKSQANPGTGWRAEYFNNTTLSGTPAVITTDDSINFNWAQNAPRGGVNADNFSIRWTATVNFAEGIYRFRIGADDGIRMYIDDAIVIDQYVPGTFRTFTQDVRLSAGQHNLRVEYFEGIDFAGVLVDWTLVEAPVQGIGSNNQPSQAFASDIESDRAVAHVGVGVLNVRANPSVGAARIAQVYLYDSYAIVGASPDFSWYLIDLGNGRTGWVLARHIRRYDDFIVPIIDAASSSVAELPDVQVTGYATSELVIRTAPRTGDQIGLLPPDVLVRVVGRTSSGSWYIVQYEGIEGWVFAPYVRLTNGRVIDIPVR